MCCVRGSAFKRRQTSRPSTVGSNRSSTNQVGHIALGGGQGFFARRHADNAVAFLVQVVADKFEKILLVVDNKHSLS